MLIISLLGRTAARVTADELVLEPSIAVLEVDHPHRRWVMCLGVFAQHVLSGEIAGPYSDSRARLFARAVLMPDDAFCEIADIPDVWIAEYFNVPLSEVEEKREDIRALAIF